MFKRRWDSDGGGFGIFDRGRSVFSGLLEDKRRSRRWRCQAFGGGWVLCGKRAGVECDVLGGFAGSAWWDTRDWDRKKSGIWALCVGGNSVGDGNGRTWMRYRVAYGSRMGVKRKVNQDALLVKCGVCEGESVVLAVVCDGMGGLRKGEVASAVVVRAFAQWFERELPVVLMCGGMGEKVFDSWEKMIQEVHRRIWIYGEKGGFEMGTTLTAMLFWRAEYYVAQVGDSRAYQVSDKVLQLTEDQTWVERQVLLGRMSRDKAMGDGRRNILLQCVGASREVKAVYKKGKVQKNVIYLICSDGFWRGMEEREFLRGKREVFLRRWIQKMLWQSQKRGERDDASAIVISI